MSLLKSYKPVTDKSGSCLPLNKSRFSRTKISPDSFVLEISESVSTEYTITVAVYDRVQSRAAVKYEYCDVIKRSTEQTTLNVNAEDDRNILVGM